MHVQRLQHLLGNLPLIGGRYRVAEYAADGRNDTLLKAAHELSGEKGRVTYGATARHVSDLADPDAHWFVLLGGQDGWLDGPTWPTRFRSGGRAGTSTCSCGWRR
jgi:penicillin amidase